MRTVRAYNSARTISISWEAKLCPDNSDSLYELGNQKFSFQANADFIKIFQNFFEILESNLVYMQRFSRIDQLTYIMWPTLNPWWHRFWTSSVDSKPIYPSVLKWSQQPWFQKISAITLSIQLIVTDQLEPLFIISFSRAKKTRNCENSCSDSTISQKSLSRFIIWFATKFLN